MAPIEFPHPLPRLADDRLRLRLPTEADVARITEICRDAEVQRWTRVPSPYTADDARAFVQLASDAYRGAAGVHLLATESDGDGDGDRVLGAVGLAVDQRDLSGEIGYWVAPDARGRGVATGACRLLLRFGLERLGVAYVALWASADNAASNAVARSLGFTHEGTSRDAMLIGPTGDPAAGVRGDAHLWGLRPGELR